MASMDQEKDDKEKKNVFTIECSHCARFFFCNGKPDKNTSCVAFVKRGGDIQHE